MKYLEEIARMQGEITGLVRSVKNEAEIHAISNIDAVHYSTRIEGNKLTLKQVTRALSSGLAGTKQQRDLKEVINYARVRRLLFEKADKKAELSLSLLFDAHKQLEDGIVEGKLRGHLRLAQNVIKDAVTNEIVYLPPEVRDVSVLMKSLFSWHKDACLVGVSQLIRAAIFHYQFVTIHPFMDGNGRIARLFSNFIVYSEGYSVSRYAALEKQHEKDRARYYLSLRQLQGNNYYDIPENIDITSWIEYWLSCLRETYSEALNRVRGIEDISGTLSSLEARLQKALSVFRRHKTISANDYEALMGLGRTQAVADINKLLQQKLIRKVGGGRSTVYSL